MSELRFHVLILVENTENGISEASQNLLRRVSCAYTGLQASIEAIIIGGNELTGRDSLSLCGVKKITHLKTFATPLQLKEVKDAVLSLIPADVIVHIFALNDLRMTDLSASLAAVKLWPVYANCTEIDTIEAIKRPIFGGKIDEIWNVSHVSCVITVRMSRENVGAVPVELEENSIEIVRNSENEYRFTLQKNSGEKGITDASIVVSGGRGMKSAENFSLLFKLAEILHGAVGASRPVVDSGWLAHEHQVGQTGRTISPNLYIACGISGSVQHIAGMSSSKCIVAINTDKDAPIFSIADYGIVGDALEILPQLTAEIEKLK